MIYRFLTSIGAAAAMMVVPAAGQAPSSAASTAKTKTWTIPRTPDGHPDLQGTWTNATLTSLERPAQFEGKAILSKAEAEAYQKRRLKATQPDESPNPSVRLSISRGFNEEFYESGTSLAVVDGAVRTSLIVDPPDGIIPPLTPEAEQRDKEAQIKNRKHPADRASDLNWDTRCIMRGTAGPPMFPQTYNDNYQIVQTTKDVMIMTELDHVVRTIPLNGRPHLPSDIHLWFGDSLGHWDGDTLVIDTTNMKPRTSFDVEFRRWPSDENLHVIERFTRTGPDKLLYKVTVDDPTTFTRPWTAEIPFNTLKGKIYEYACHEGNYAIVDELKAARQKDQKAEQAGKKETK